MRLLLSLAGPFISLITPSLARLATLNVADHPFFNRILAPHDYIDAYGLPVDIHEYSWGGYAKKLNTPVRSTNSGVLHHQLLSRQSQCTALQTTCPQGNCCDPGQICTGATTCCNQDQIGCGEACCNAGQECCGRKCCNTGNGFQCSNSECIAVAANNTSTSSATRSSFFTRSSSFSSTRTRSSATRTPTSGFFNSGSAAPSLSKITTIVGTIAGIVISLGVVACLTVRNRRRRWRLAEAQRAAEAQNFLEPQPQPQPPPTFVPGPVYQPASTVWVPPPKPLPSTSIYMPSYYADQISSTANTLPSQNQQKPYYTNEFSQQPSTAPYSEFSSTHGGSSDYQPKPWATPLSTYPQGVNTPPTAGSSASQPSSGDASAAGLGRQNTKARYVTAAQREEAAWDPKRKETPAVGTSTAGASSANTSTIAGMANEDVGPSRSATPTNSASNSSRPEWARDDLGPADPPVPRSAPDLPPPAYSEYQQHGGSHAS